jgi:hypothetical protein
LRVAVRKKAFTALTVPASDGLKKDEHGMLDQHQALRK